MSTNILTWAIIRILTQKGRKSIREIMRNCARANDLSRELLMRIVADNKDTEYGKRYNFDQIRSIDDFKRLVPFSSYDDYAPYIELMINKGEKNLITTYPIVQYAETSGSIGVPKKIPVSKQAMGIYTKYTITRVTALADR